MSALTSSNRNCNCLCGECGFRLNGEKRGGGSSSKGSGEEDTSGVFLDIVVKNRSLLQRLFVYFGAFASMTAARDIPMKIRGD